MLLSDDLFKRKLVEIVDTLSQKKVTVSVLDDIAAPIERFIVVQLLTSGVVAVATGLSLWALVLGSVGTAARGADDDGYQGGLRPRGAAAARRSPAWRLTARRATYLTALPRVTKTW